RQGDAELVQELGELPVLAGVLALAVFERVRRVAAIGHAMLFGPRRGLPAGEAGHVSPPPGAGTGVGDALSITTRRGDGGHRPVRGRGSRGGTRPGMAGGAPGTARISARAGIARGSR